jgi:hypothetical protein
MGNDSANRERYLGRVNPSGWPAMVRILASSESGDSADSIASLLRPGGQTWRLLLLGDGGFSERLQQFMAG